MSSRKPTLRHVLQGTFRPDRHAPIAPSKASGDCPKKPAWLKGAAAKVWNREAPLWHSVGLLDPVTTLFFALLCDRLAEYIEASADVRTRGEFIAKADASMVRNPSATSRNAAERAVLKLCSEGGLTPASRQRLGVVLPTDKPGGKARFFPVHNPNREAV